MHCLFFSFGVIAMMLIANFSSSQESTYPVDTNLFLDQVEPPKDDYLLSMLPEFSESIPVDTFSELNPVGGFFELNPIDDSFINEFILPTGDALFTEQIPDEFQNPNTDLVADSATGCSSLSLSRSRVRSRSDVCPAQDRYLTVNTDEDVKKYWCFKINPDFANIPVCRIRNTDVQIMEERLRALTGDVSSDVLPQVEFSYLVEGTLLKPLNYIICADEDAYCCKSFKPFISFERDPTKLNFFINDGFGYWCARASRNPLWVPDF